MVKDSEKVWIFGLGVWRSAFFVVVAFKLNFCLFFFFKAINMAMGIDHKKLTTQSNSKRQHENALPLVAMP